MEKNEETPGQSEQELELEPEVVTTTDDDAQGDDPLDFLVGEDALRAEAKKFRAMAKRKARAPVPTVNKPEKVIVSPVGSDFVKKSDLERSATREAKKLVGPEIAAEYEELIKIPLGGYDSLDPDSIAQNLKERYKILQDRKTAPVVKPDISDLTATKVSGTGAGGEEKKPDKKDPPNFNLPKQPTDWYGKKS